MDEADEAYDRWRNDLLDQADGERKREQIEGRRIPPMPGALVTLFVRAQPRHSSQAGLGSYRSAR